MPGLDAMRWGANTYSYLRRGPAPDAFRGLFPHFSDFELMAYPGHLWPFELGASARAAIRARLNDAGARVVALNMPNVDINIAAAVPEMRDHSVRILTGIIDLAGSLGAQGIVVGPGKANPLFPEPRAMLEDYFLTSLDRLHAVATNVGVELWVENMPFSFLPKAGDVMGALARFGREDVKVVYDAANAYFAGEDPCEALVEMAPRLALVHLSDTGTDVYRHDPVGTGTVDFEAVAEAVRRLDYAGTVVLEVISADPDRELPDSRRALEHRGWSMFDATASKDRIRC